MLKTSLIAVAFVLGATPVLAQSLNDCYEPIPPAAVDGGAATEAQMKAAQSDVKDFIKASDDYQDCLNHQFAELKRKAAMSKDKQPLDPSIQAEVAAREDKNQKTKEKVGAEFNAAVAAYNAKHPKS